MPQFSFTFLLDFLQVDKLFNSEQAVSREGAHTIVNLKVGVIFNFLLIKKKMDVKTVKKDESTWNKLIFQPMEEMNYMISDRICQLGGQLDNNYKMLLLLHITDIILFFLERQILKIFKYIIFFWREYFFGIFIGITS